MSRCSLGVALIAQAWRMKDYSLNVSIARERQDDDPEMLCNYHRYFRRDRGALLVGRIDLHRATRAGRVGR